MESQRPKPQDPHKRVDLKALCGLVKLEEIEKSKKLPENGALNAGFDLSKVEGLPANVGFGKQIFGCKKGKSIVPHGHANMCTGFIILKGKWHGRHYDRLETHADHYVIKPTIDRHLRPVGKPAPPRPRRPERSTRSIVASAPISCARASPRPPVSVARY